MNSRIEEVNDVAELARYASKWNELHRQTPDATFFQTWEWLATTWKRFPRPQKLRLIVVLEGDEPVCLVPFCIREQSYRVGRLRVLSYPLEDWGPFFAPIGLQRTEGFRRALEHVLHHDGDWDLIELRYLCDREASFGDLQETLMNRRQTFYRRPRMVVPVIGLNGSWEKFERQKSKNWRRSRRREREQIEKLGEVRLVSYRPDPASGEFDPRTDLWDDCLQVAERSWQATSKLGAAFCSAAVRPVLADLHEIACRRGMVEMNVLYLNERPVAFLYGYVCGGELYALRSGFDASCQAKGLGTVLLYEVVKRCYQRQDRRINLGPGDQEYKLRFATDCWQAINFVHYAPWSLRAQALRWKTAVDPYLPGFADRCQKRLVT